MVQWQLGSVEDNLRLVRAHCATQDYQLPSIHVSSTRTKLTSMTGLRGHALFAPLTDRGENLTLRWDVCGKVCRILRLSNTSSASRALASSSASVLFKWLPWVRYMLPSTVFSHTDACWQCFLGVEVGCENRTKSRLSVTSMQASLQQPWRHWAFVNEVIFSCLKSIRLRYRYWHSMFLIPWCLALNDILM